MNNLLSCCSTSKFIYNKSAGSKDNFLALTCYDEKMLMMAQCNGRKIMTPLSLGLVSCKPHRELSTFTVLYWAWNLWRSWLVILLGWQPGSISVCFHISIIEHMDTWTHILPCSLFVVATLRNTLPTIPLGTLREKNVSISSPRSQRLQPTQATSR